MKELSIKEKAKAYDEAIKRAKATIKVAQNQKEVYDCIKTIFPELKESGEEQHRKWILEYLYDGLRKSDEQFKDQFKCAIAWLEKQGRHSIYNVPSREVILAIWDLGNEWKELTNGSISTEYGTQLDYIQKHWRESEYYLREKQGEQKHKDRYTFKSIPRLLDMIEPTDKAKSYCQKLIDSLLQEGYATDAKIVSDCLKQMNGEKVAMAVMDIEKQGEQPKEATYTHEVETGNGNIKALVTEKVQLPKFHEGDWVIGRATENEPRQIAEIKEEGYKTTYGGWIGFSFEEDMRLWTIQDAKNCDVLSDGTTIFIFKDLLSDGSVMSYCDYDTDSGESDAFCPVSMNLMCSIITPATKEQRDTLEKAIADAGYTFDFEKKELKKIDNEEVNGEDYGIDSLCHAQRILEKTLGEVEGYQSDDGILDHKAAITAVKLLYKQKPAEWSEEDENEVAVLEAYIRSNDWSERHIDRALGIVDELVNKVKSLRPQNRWKPSEAQISALDFAIDCTVYPEFQDKRNVLIELLEQLKQL